MANNAGDPTKLAAALVNLPNFGNFPLPFAGGDAMTAVEAILKTIQTQIGVRRELSPFSVRALCLYQRAFSRQCRASDRSTPSLTLCARPRTSPVRSSNLPMNFFRIGDVFALLIEHWDVLQDEATQDASVSGLPMFGDVFPT
jgi:hypothetical protein